MAEFNNPGSPLKVPVSIEAEIRAFEALYSATQRQLEAYILRFNNDDLAALLRRVNGAIDNLDAQSISHIKSVVHRIVIYETRLAERLLQAPMLTISKETMALIEARTYSTFHQLHEDVRQNVTNVLNRGFERGLSLEKRKAFTLAVINEIGPGGLMGGKMSLAATGSALVRTRTAQLANETKIERYKSANIEKVEYVAELGDCTFEPNCGDLNGIIYKIDQIPEDVTPPIHLWCRCTLAPVV